MRAMMKTLSLMVLGAVLGIAAIAGSVASSRVPAQADPVVQPTPAFQNGQRYGTIITGENIGFQLLATGRSGDVATGRLMIKVNGQWLPATASLGVMPAK
jgi:hypothetical protein